MDPNPEQVSAYAEWLDSAERIAATLEKVLSAKVRSVKFSVVMHDEPGRDPYYSIDARLQSANVNIGMREEEFLFRSKTKEDYVALVDDLARRFRKALGVSNIPGEWYEAREKLLDTNPFRAKLVENLTKAERQRDELATQDAINSIYAAHEAQVQRQERSPGQDSK